MMRVLIAVVVPFAVTAIEAQMETYLDSLEKYAKFIYFRDKIMYC